MLSGKNGKVKAIIIFRDEEQHDRVSISVSNDVAKGKWMIKNLTTASVGLWEPSYDTELWKQQHILNIFVQNVEQGDGEQLKNIPAQPISVLEWNPGWK